MKRRVSKGQRFLKAHGIAGTTGAVWHAASPGDALGLTGRPEWLRRCSSSPCTRGPSASRRPGSGGSASVLSGSTVPPSHAASAGCSSYLQATSGWNPRDSRLGHACAVAHSPMTQHVSTLYLSISARSWARKLSSAFMLCGQSQRTPV